MKTRSGFTLVEILIVVIILGVLAAIVLPQFSNASANARASMLGDNLRIIRAQIEVFTAQHGGMAPGYPAGGGAPSSVQFVAHLTSASNSAGTVGDVGDAAFPFGPYMQRMPVNSVNGLNTVRVLGDAEAFPAAPTDQYGWLYKPATREFRADSPGTDEAGLAFYEY